MIRKIVPDPKVLAKLAQLAVIRENPFAGGHSIPTTTRKDFDRKIIASIDVAHYASALTGATKFKTDKRIGQLARKLAKTLEASDKERLSHFLPHGSTVDAHIAALNDLADAARWIGRLKKAPRLGKARAVSKTGFVERLLDAAHDAGGRLTLNRRNGGGSLTEAIDLLAPYLPPETSATLSVATLRRIRDAWLKNNKNSSKKSLN